MGSKRTVLIVEDEIHLLESIKEMLFINGYEVFAANNGLSALELLNNEKIDIVICDINLPDITGYEILSEAKKGEKNYNIPFIFLSAFADESDVRKGMNEGADDYITKPFKFQSLLDTIKCRLEIHDNKAALNNSILNNKLFQILNKNFVHEFLNPLNGILSLSELINSDDNISVEVKKFTTLIYTSGYRMFRNVRKLIYYSFISSDNAPTYSREDVDITDTLTQVLHSSFKEDAYSLDMVNSIIVPRLSSEMVRILIEEIIDNSIKFSKPQSKPTINLYKTSGNFYFKVSNVVENDLKFTIDDIKPFRKFHEDKDMNGLGLGLYISKNICETLNLKFNIFIHNSKFEVTIVSQN